MFSPSDIATMNLWYNAGGIKDVSTFSLGLITSYGVYAITVTDPGSFANFAAQYNNQEKLHTIEVYYQLYLGSETNTEANAIKGISLLLNHLNSGLRISKATNSMYTSWDHYSGNYVNNSVTIKPCQTTEN